MARSFSTNLNGKVRNFSLLPNNALVPLYEAIVNSIQAIDERRNQEEFKGKIEIKVIRGQTIFQEENTSITGFVIKDNGIGFNEENMASFMEADSDHKLEIGGKGVGRFSWLKAFSSVRIESVFCDIDDSFVKRQFEFTLAKREIEDILEKSEKEDFFTVIELKKYLPEYANCVPQKIETIALRIIQHCFIYFLRKNCPEIKIYDGNETFLLNQIVQERFTTDENKIFFEVDGQRFSLLNIKINDKTFSDKNCLYLCANERLVKKQNLERSIVNLDSKIFEQKGYWYLGVLTGKYLDENVDMNRLSFSIPSESGEVLTGYPGMNDIIKKACEYVEKDLHEYLCEVDKQKRARIKKYTTEVAPQYRHLEHHVPDQIGAIKPGLSDNQLDDELYKIKRAFENETKKECDALLSKLNQGHISSEEYQKQFSRTVERVSDANRAALADYVVHRRIILDLFSSGLKIKADGKFNLESYMHELIYPMRKTSDELPYESHNLWLIDEKLSFCQFISSDKPFDNKLGEDRADLLILDNPVAMAESENTGIVYDTIIVIELKRPMRDDYDMENNPITQLDNYVQKIRDGNAKDSNHRPIKVTPNTQFYLYAICDITPTLEKVLDWRGFSRSPDGLGAYFYNNIMHSYTEVLSFDKIRFDSEKRNKILFNKLGIN